MTSLKQEYAHLSPLFSLTFSFSYQYYHSFACACALLSSSPMSFPKQGLFLEKLGICHRYQMWRIALNGIPVMKSSYLIIKDLAFDDIPVRVYWPRTPSTSRRGILYLHGGIGVCGSILKLNHWKIYISVHLCIRFRLVPEYPSHVTIRDCCTAATHFLKNAKAYGVDPNRVLIAGDSSGGTFAAAVSQKLVMRDDLPRLRAQVLLYPFLQAVDFSLPSHQHGFYFLTGKQVDVDGIMKNAHVPEHVLVKCRKWISADNIPEQFKVRGYTPPVPAPFSKQLYETCKAAFDPTFSPLLAEDCIIRRLPDTFIYTCEYDVIRDDGLLYKKRLEDNGVSVTWFHVKNGYHGILFTLGCQCGETSWWVPMLCSPWFSKNANLNLFLFCYLME
uniref:Alpha/beta hydrolase fold-3 domain-containing protein n=1 Tax=Varanus komodoensis TaxID=61221 RepID=A0A8D2LM50_VARKO